MIGRDAAVGHRTESSSLLASHFAPLRPRLANARHFVGRHEPRSQRELERMDFLVGEIQLRSRGRAASGPSEAWTRFICRLLLKSPRIVPGG